MRVGIRRHGRAVQYYRHFAGRWFRWRSSAIPAGLALEVLDGSEPYSHSHEPARRRKRRLVVTVPVECADLAKAGLCWRCRRVLTIHGVCCRACEPALMAEYERERARRGVRWLYLGDDRGADGASRALARHGAAARRRRRRGSVETLGYTARADGGAGGARVPGDGGESGVGVHDRDWWESDPMGCGMNAQGAC